MQTIIVVNDQAYLVQGNVDLNALAHAFRGARALDYDWKKESGFAMTISPTHPTFMVKLEEDGYAGYKKIPVSEPVPGADNEAPSATNAEPAKDELPF